MEFYFLEALMGVNKIVVLASYLVSARKEFENSLVIVELGLSSKLNLNILMIDLSSLRA